LWFLQFLLFLTGSTV